MEKENKPKFTERLKNTRLVTKARDKWIELKAFFKDASKEVYCSMALMGLGQVLYKKIGLGIVYFLVEVAYLVFFFMFGIENFSKMITLGTVEADAWLGIKGDDSVVCLLLGVVTLFITFAFIALYLGNIRNAYSLQQKVKANKPLGTFKDDIKSIFNENFYKLALVVPLTGVAVFNVLPIVFMIFIAFTNYGGDIVPPKLVDWNGLGNFIKIFSLGGIQQTLFKILGWNVLWAILATILAYLLGLGLSLLLNKKYVRGKTFWRFFPILAYAVPSFITLLGFKFMFSQGGPINDIIRDLGGESIGFLDMDHTWSARFIGLAIQCWLHVPSLMLLITGMLSNINTDMYEAAEVEGASKFQIFKKITLPFIIFSTTPTIITNFISNFNNFGIFYLLRGTIISDGYFLASDTDLLINWLYNLSIKNNYFGLGASVSLIIFLITSTISLIVYLKSPAYKQEDTFR